MSFASSFKTAESHIKAGRFKQGAKLLEKLAAKERRGQYLFYAGWARLQGGQPLRALKNFRHIQNLNNQWSKRATTWIKKVAKSLSSAAVKDYQKYRYLRAIEKCEATLSISSISKKLSGSTQVMLGLSLFRIGKTLEGRKLIKIGNLKIKDRKTTSLLNELLKQAKRSTEIQGSVSINTGYNSNIFGEGHSEDKTASSSTELDLFFKRDLKPVSVFADANYHEQWGMSDLRWFSAQVGSEWSAIITETLFSPSISFKYSNLGGKSYLLVPSATLAFSRRINTSEINLDYSFSRPIAPLDEFSFATGQIHEFSLSYGQMIRPRFPPKISLFGSIEDSGDLLVEGDLLPLAHYGLGISGISNFTVNHKNTVGVMLTIEHRQYYELAKPGNEARSDWEETLKVFWVRNLSRLLNLKAALNIGINQSTLGENSVDDKNRFGILLTFGIEANYQRIQ